MWAIDSNIWAYALDATVPEHRSARRAVRRVLPEGVFLNTVVQIEVLHYLVKRLGVVAGKGKMETFLALPATVDPLDPPLVRAAAAMLARYSERGVGGRDATLLASMERNGVRRLLTHDAAFRRIDGLEVRDPIR